METLLQSEQKTTLQDSQTVLQEASPSTNSNSKENLDVANPKSYSEILIAIRSQNGPDSLSIKLDEAGGIIATTILEGQKLTPKELATIYDQLPDDFNIRQLLRRSDFEQRLAQEELELRSKTPEQKTAITEFLGRARAKINQIDTLGKEKTGIPSISTSALIGIVTLLGTYTTIKLLEPKPIPKVETPKFQMIPPVAIKGDGKYRVNSGFGWRIHPTSGGRKFHNGVDSPAATGTPLVATMDGTIQNVVRMDEFAGNKVSVKSTIIKDGQKVEVVSSQLHLSKINGGLEVGKKIKKGTVIGEVGTTGNSSGPHAHISVRLADPDKDASKFKSTKKTDLGTYIDPCAENLFQCSGKSNNTNNTNEK
jgi:murein DD-endopeptidase MepM/ murein hydrolase activator NlpD